MNIVEFERLMDFFHDGLIDHIEQVGKNIYFWMESAQLEPEWIEEFQVHVNPNMSIKGVFHCINIKSLIIDHTPVEIIKMDHDRAEILDFDVEENGVSLLVIWLDWNNRNISSNVGLIKIQAEQFYWQYDEYISASEEQKFESSYRPPELG